MVPVTREVVLDGDTPVSAFAKLHRGPYGFLLESLEGGERWARYTFLATDPREVFRYRGRALRALDREPRAGAAVETDVAPLEHLGGLLRRHPPVDVPGLPRFTGGAVGYLGYDIVRTIESLPDAPPDDRDLPDARDDGDRHAAGARQSVQSRHRHRQRRGRARGGRRRAAGGSTPRPEPRSTTGSAGSRRPGTMRPLAIDPPGTLPPAIVAVRRRRGSRTTCGGSRSTSPRATPFRPCSRGGSRSPHPIRSSTYRYLRALNPAPYLYYLHCDDIHVIGSSPEILVRVEDGEVTLRPIAGTRPARRAPPEEDAALAAELAADPKERAEHLMLVDLGRNDVGRVAEFGSVRLTAFMTIERYSHVMHLVSEVRGRLRPELDAVAALAASFPGRHRLRRAQGAGDADHRRAGAGPPRPLCRRRRLHRVGRRARWTRPSPSAPASCAAAAPGSRPGAGIVADSDPASEWRETEAKARAVLLALALASAGSSRTERTK